MTSPAARFGCSSATCVSQRSVSWHISLTGYAPGTGSLSNRGKCGAGYDKHYIVSVL